MGVVDVSVVVPTYNRAEMVCEAIESLVHQETDSQFSFEIVVVDNASTDSTKGAVQRVAEFSPIPIRYAFEEAAGDAHARNTGVKGARADWLAFLDDDEFADKDWLRQLYFTALGQNALIVGGEVRLVLSDEQKRAFGRALRKALRETQHGKDVVRRYTGGSLPAAGNMLVKRAVFDRVGLFDTSMLAGGSDSDLVLRARAAGYDLWYTPKAVVHHRVPPHRLTRAYLRWDSLRDGTTLAFLDYKFRGRGRVMFFCCARIGQALLVNLPQLFFAFLSGDDLRFLGRGSLLWRAVGYARECLFLFAPTLFPQERFFAALEFHSARKKFSGVSSTTETSTLGNA